nr:insulinase family protein [uncultured Halomonas sp.]
MSEVRGLPPGSRMAERRLAGGPRVLAIEVPTARQVRLACAIGAGYLDEPEQLPGLAHLLEHALFLGSSCHPEAGDFAAWINDQGGRYNAHTDEYSTDVHLTLPPEATEPGLERLLDIVLHPLLSETHIAREVEVIEAEFQARLNDPELHRQRALSQLFQTSHPAFDCHHGNRESLGADISTLCCALRDFHARHYRAEGLSLVMLGPQPLDQQLDLLMATAAEIPAGASNVPAQTWRWAEPSWIQWCLPKHHPPAQPVLELIWPLPDPLTPMQRQVAERLAQELNDGALAATLAQHDAVRDMTPRLNPDGGTPFLLLPLTLSESGRQHRESLIATCQARVEDVATRLTPGDALGQPGSLIHNLDTWPKTLARRLAVDTRTLSMTRETSDANASLDDQAIKTLAPMLTAKCCRILEALPALEQGDVMAGTGTRFKRHSPPASVSPRPSLAKSSLARSSLVMPWRLAPSIPGRILLTDETPAAPDLILDSERIALWWSNEPPLAEAFWCLGWTAPATHQAARLARWQHNTLALRQAGLAQGVTLRLGGDDQSDWLMATGDASRLESSLVKALELWPSQISEPPRASVEGLVAQRLLNLLTTLPTPREKSDTRPLAWAGGALSATEAQAGCRRLMAAFGTALVNSAPEGNTCASMPSPVGPTTRSTGMGWPTHWLPPQGEDAAVMLQVDAADASPENQALFQLLAQCHDAAFHHEMRQRRRLGYVAAVRYREAPDGWPRLGYVVQSPHASVETLREAVSEFLKTRGATLAYMDSTDFARRCTALKASWGYPETQEEAQTRAWQALRQHHGTLIQPTVKPQAEILTPWTAQGLALRKLTPDALTSLARALAEERLSGQWWAYPSRHESSLREA